MQAVLKLTGVVAPDIHTYLGGNLALGSRVKLSMTLRRTKKGRSEELVLDGIFLVGKVDHLPGTGKTVLEVSPLGPSPAWKAVRKLPTAPLPAAKSPRTPLSD